MKIEVVSENKICPKEYSDYLIRIGGLNPYGLPNFRFVWGARETKKLYGQMADSYRGQHIRLKYHGIAAWHFEEWKPGEHWGTPEEWYEKSYDISTGLHTMGDYPFRGDYICQMKLYERKFDKGKLIIDAWPLSYELISLLVPAMWQARSITAMERRFYSEQERAKEKAEFHRVAMDAYMDGTPAFCGADFVPMSGEKSQRERMIQKFQFPISAEEIKKKMGTGHNQVQI